VCRHLAYLGVPRRIGELLVDPPHGLVTQSWAPRRQRHGAVNADGFGIGWYVEGLAEPARHRGAGPVWADETFADLTRVVTTGCLLAAVRSATPGMPAGAAAAAPFRRGRRLFSHNGRVEGWPKAAEPLAARLPPGRLLGLDTLSDSGLLWALVDDQLDRGRDLGPALAEVVALAREVGAGRFNFLLTDGTAVAATAAGDSLFWRVLPGGDGDGRGGVVVASEPYDDEEGWREVPDGHLVVATAAGVSLIPL
jgi:gamma-glutamyl hercynylcysteine S-oxide hydrolase